MTDDRAMAELARLLHQLRRREARRRGGAELTYRELAARTNWSLGIIAQYFSGRSLPPVDRFDTLVRLLGASAAEQGTLATVRDRADEHRRRLPRGTSAGTRRADVRVLGPVEVVGPGGRAALSGTRQRALIGLLALHPGRVVTQDRLVDALWGENPPRTAVKTLYSYVTRVRQALDSSGLPGVLLTQASGYLLSVHPDEVDAARFERELGRARQAIADGMVPDAATYLGAGLALWRGEALCDAAPTGWGLAEVRRLHELRLGAHEDLWEARLRLGEHDAATRELGTLLVAYPARERLVELFMVALYRSGRHTEAIEAYQRLCGQLADYLGVTPSPRILRTYAAVLRRDPELDAVTPTPAAEPARRPAQLPARTGHFTGRAAELAVLNSLGRRERRVAVVCGPAGIGKTALAVRWAHRAAGRYPDGQLFVDLRGHDPATSMTLAETLSHLLAALAVPAAEIPATPDEQVGLYRSVLHRRRVLILLDNAASADQVTRLVPPSAGSLLLITSRNQLTGLVVDHAVTAVDLDVLSADDALILVRRVLGTRRVAREEDAAGALIDLCGRMPLALRIATAKLATRPLRPIADLVTDLTSTDRLTVLAVPGDSRSIRTVFTSAYAALSRPAADLFRRMGCHPGPTFTTCLAAAVTGTPSDQARRALDELVGCHLVVELGADRYRFHDLIRIYAAERADRAEAAATASRITDWYLAVADAANQVFDPVRDRAGPVAVTPPVEIPFPADHDHALAFLDAERPNLLPVVRAAGERGHDAATWRLAYLLTSFHALRGHWPDQVDSCREGLSAACRLDDPDAEALTRSLLGMACNAIQRYSEGLIHLDRALILSRVLGDRRGQGLALNNMAFAHAQLGRLDAAVDLFGQALTLHQDDGNLSGVTLALNNLGHMNTLTGRPELALGHLGRALALAREIDNPGLEAMTLDSLGEARLAEADHDAALVHLTEALAIRRRIGERRGEAETLNLIGLAHRGRGDQAAATAHFQAALALSRDLGDPHLEAATVAHLRASATATLTSPAG